MSGLSLQQVDWWAVRPGPDTPPDPEACSCWWQRDEDGRRECGGHDCRCPRHCAADGGETDD